MKRFNTTPLIVVIVIITLGYLFLTKEKYTSPGTLVQLTSSHVPTQEDADYYKNIYPKMVRRDITDMTGEDPGNIAIPMPQMFE